MWLKSVDWTKVFGSYRYKSYSACVYIVVDFIELYCWFHRIASTTNWNIGHKCSKTHLGGRWCWVFRTMKKKKWFKLLGTFIHFQHKSNSLNHFFFFIVLNTQHHLPPRCVFEHLWPIFQLVVDAILWNQQFF